MSDDSLHDQIDWSYSNARTYEDCQRAFYHQQEQISSTGSQSDPDSLSASDGRSERLDYPLWRQASPGSIIGVAVHQSIGEQIELWKCGDHMNMTDAQEAAIALIRAHTERPEFTNQAMNTTPVETRDSLISTAKSHIRVFFREIWTRYSSHRYITHESLHSFTVDGHRVWVRPDLCTRDRDGRFIVTDWKTNSLDTFAEATLQLRVYALWAYRQFEPDLSQLRTQLVSTSDGEIQMERFDSSDLRSVERRIVSDCEDWNSKSVISQFTPSPAIERCRYCPHLSECEEGTEVVSSD
jgi:hypothetical protein